MTTHGHVAGSMRRTIENLREENAGLALELKGARAKMLDDVRRMVEGVRKTWLRDGDGVPPHDDITRTCVEILARLVKL